MPTPNKNQLPESWRCVVDLLSTADRMGFSDLENRMQLLGHSFAPIADLMVLSGVIQPAGCQVAEGLWRSSSNWQYEDCYMLAGGWWKQYRGLSGYERYLLDHNLHVSPGDLLAKLPASNRSGP